MQNEELLDLYFLPNVIKVIKLQGMSWMGQVVYMIENMHTGLWWGSL
jgi:hypothetical protein